MDMIEKAREIALKEIEEYGVPSLVHFELSEKKALELAEKLGADKTIVSVGVYLMDLKIGKALKEKRLADHVAMSSESAKEFLSAFDIRQVTKDRIINCIEAHHAAIPFICKEAEICANSDCYRFLHPTGIFAYLITVGSRTNNLVDALSFVEKKMEEKHNILSLEICKKELEPFYQEFKELIRKARP